MWNSILAAAPTFWEELYEETKFNIISPVVPGYHATMTSIAGVMPARNVEYMVLYVPNSSGPSSPTSPPPGPGGDDPDDPSATPTAKPQGLGGPGGHSATATPAPAGPGGHSGKPTPTPRP